MLRFGTLPGLQVGFPGVVFGVAGGGAPPAAVPVNDTAPTITWTGDLEDGTVQTLGTGTWTNSPTSYSIDYKLDGVTVQTYVIAAGDPEPTRAYNAATEVGKARSIEVIATNGDGASLPATSIDYIGLYDPLIYETDFVGTPGTMLKNQPGWFGNGQTGDGTLLVGTQLTQGPGSVGFYMAVLRNAGTNATIRMTPGRSPGDTGGILSLREYLLIHEDVSNFVKFMPAQSNYVIQQRLAGTESNLAAVFGMDNPAGTYWELRYNIVAGVRYIRVYKDGVETPQSATANGGLGHGPVDASIVSPNVGIGQGYAGDNLPHTLNFSISVPYENSITLNIVSQVISPDDPAKTRVTFEGEYTGAITDLQFLATLADGTEVLSWTTPTPVSGGTFSIDVDIPLSDGEAFVAYVRDPAFPASATSVNGFASVRSTIGMNVAGYYAPSYAEWYDNTFRDWADMAEFIVTGGAYAGANRNALAQAGFLDRYNRLQAIPPGATGIRVMLPWKLTVAGRGPRYLKLPPGQDFTLTSSAGSTVSKNLVTGDSVLTVVGDETADYNVLYFDVDFATFTPWTRFSMRKLDDATSEILTDEAIAAYQPFTPLRLMDVMNANNEVYWKDFPNRWHAGWTVEAAAELCNRTGNQAWLSYGYASDINRATPADVTAYCALFRSLLDPGISSPIVDAYNEAQWNTAFPGSFYLAQLGIMAGYGTGDGIGETTYVPSDFFEITDQQGWSNDGARTTTVAITAGQRFIANVSGYGVFAWLCTTNAPIGTAIPAVSNSFFTVISSGELARPRMAGVVAYNCAVAAKAGDPGVINVQNFQSASAYTGTAYDTAFFSPTGGTGDRLIDVIDGLSPAPYANLVSPDAATILAMAPGATRIAGLAASIADNVTDQIANFQTTIENGRAAFVAAGRTGSPQFHIYETGDHVFVYVADSGQRAAMANDINAYHLSTECGDSTYDLLTGLANAGAKTVTVFCFGPNDKIPSNSTFQQNFSHARAINDTTSARIAADRAAAAEFN